MKQVLNRLLVISILIYIGFGISLYLRQNSIIYYPKYSDLKLEECAKSLGAIPIVEGDVKGVLFQKSTSSLIIIYHSNATSACERESYAVALHDNPSSIFFVSYPQYLGDTSKVSSKAILNQVEATLEWVKNNKYTVKGVVGESIGVGPASYYSYLSPSPLVLIAPYKKLSDIALNIYWMYPAHLLISHDFNVEKWAGKAPRILLIIGTSDNIIKNKLSLDLYNSLPKEQEKELFKLDGFDHIDLLSKSEVPDLVRQFMEKQ